MESTNALASGATFCSIGCIPEQPYRLTLSSVSVLASRLGLGEATQAKWVLLHGHKRHPTLAVLR